MKKTSVVKSEGLKTQKFSVVYEENKYSYTLQEPTFEQLSAAMAESIGLSGKLNMTGGGKAIWELCCLEHSEEIVANPRLLMTVCISIYSDYVLPVDAEIKKN